MHTVWLTWSERGQGMKEMTIIDLLSDIGKH